MVYSTGWPEHYQSDWWWIQETTEKAKYVFWPIRRPLLSNIIVPDVIIPFEDTIERTRRLADNFEIGSFFPCELVSYDKEI